MSNAEFEMLISFILVLGGVILSFAYAAACNNWAKEIQRKCLKIQAWIEKERRE